GDGARSLMAAGSVLGDPFDLDLARAVAGLTLDEALAAADQLSAHGLVLSGTTLKDLRFRHPVFRSAVYEGLGAADRLRGHARAAEALRSAGRPVVDQARHLAQTVAPGDDA